MTAMPKGFEQWAAEGGALMENLTDIIAEEVRQNAVCHRCGTRKTRLVLEPVRYSTNKGKTRRYICGLPTLNGARVYYTISWGLIHLTPPRRA